MREQYGAIKKAVNSVKNKTWGYFRVLSSLFCTNNPSQNITSTKQYRTRTPPHNKIKTNQRPLICFIALLVNLRKTDHRKFGNGPPLTCFVYGVFVFWSPHSVPFASLVTLLVQFDPSVGILRYVLYSFAHICTVSLYFKHLVWWIIRSNSGVWRLLRAWNGPRRSAPQIIIQPLVLLHVPPELQTHKSQSWARGRKRPGVLGVTASRVPPHTNL